MRKVPKSQQKLYSILVRCNPEEAALVKKYAAEENLDMSKFMRKLLSKERTGFRPRGN
jgi:hypothetical protein